MKATVLKCLGFYTALLESHLSVVVFIFKKKKKQLSNLCDYPFVFLCPLTVCSNAHNVIPPFLGLPFPGSLL